MNPKVIKYIIYSLVMAGLVLMDMSMDTALLNTPFLISLAALCIFFVVLYLVIKNRTLRIVLANIASLILVFITFEKVLQIQEKRKEIAGDQMMIYRYGKNLYRPHQKIGYVHIPRYEGQVFAKAGDSVLYNVVYRTDETGCRTMGHVNPEKATQNVLFFGCSFTFGFGLEDNQTLPWLLRDSLNGKSRVYNFGVNGYGPHQILATIESNVIDSVVKEKPNYFIYSAIASHAERIINMYPSNYKDTDPKYILNSHNELEFAGTFGDSSLRWQMYKEFRESLLYKKIFKKQNLTDRDLDLYASIVAACRDKINNKYPNCEFHVLFWDDQYLQKELSEKLITRLKAKEINVHLMRDILPEYQSKSYIYTLSPQYDGHPNHLANRHIAAYIKRNIIGNTNQLAYE